MFSNKARLIFALIVLGIMFFGLASIQSLVYSGNVVYDRGVPPLVATTFNLKTGEVGKDVLYDLLDKEDSNIILKPIVEGTNEDYLFLRWNRKISSLSIYMRQVGDGDSNFELWGPEKKKIASGKLTNEYEWYEFDLTKEDLSFEDYALFDYGSTDIKIDKILANEMPEAKINRLIGVLTEGFV